MHRVSLCRVAAFSAALALLGCGMIQDRFLYYPDRSVPSEEALHRAGLRFWPERPGYRGFVHAVGGPQLRGTVVVFHGNAGSASDRTYYAAALAPLGYRVLLAEYPGYGGRPGKVGEGSFVADAREALRRAFDEFGAPLFVLGESLGAGVAAAAIRDAPVPVRGVILITPWDTLANVARQHFPALAVRCLLTDRYENAANLRSFAGPVAVAAAEGDEIIPVALARELYASLRGPKRFWVLPNAGHNDWPAVVGPTWWRELMEFVESPVGPPS